jgi:hypothetical protein
MHAGLAMLAISSGKFIGKLSGVIERSGDPPNLACGQWCVRGIEITHISRRAPLILLGLVAGTGSSGWHSSMVRKAPS